MRTHESSLKCLSPQTPPLAIFIRTQVQPIETIDVSLDVLLTVLSSTHQSGSPSESVILE
jgi:uncharacterized protein YggT (Ycf19 family)